MVVLIRQYRYAAEGFVYEIPAGRLNSDETPENCARRELKEETGYTADQWAYAGKMLMAVGFTNEVIHIYFAKGLTRGERQLDDGEFLDLITLTPDALQTQCQSGLVTDAKTLTCMLWLQNVLNGAWKLDWNFTENAV